MAEKSPRAPLTGSTKTLQENVTRAAPAAGAAYSLVGALLLLGAIGWGVDRWQGTAPWGLLIGLLLGMVVGFYELVKAVYWK